MATLSVKKRSIRDRNLLWALADMGLAWGIGVAAIEFHYQYLHNPAVHMWFQNQGIFLF
jgi:hypothetical protein|tara:strand:+ start:296 stop:472 length:177 start_codon:yes stop_codon:yes gene_type:complete